VRLPGRFYQVEAGSEAWKCLSLFPDDGCFLVFEDGEFGSSGLRFTCVSDLVEFVGSCVGFSFAVVGVSGAWAAGLNDHDVLVRVLLASAEAADR
jgi:hypothetical protein